MASAQRAAPILGEAVHGEIVARHRFGDVEDAIVTLTHAAAHLRLFAGDEALVVAVHGIKGVATDEGIAAEVEAEAGLRVPVEIEERVVDGIGGAHLAAIADGSHTVTASYQGAANFNTSNNSVGQVVNKVLQRLKTTEVAEEQSPATRRHTRARVGSSSQYGVVVDGAIDPNVLVRMAKCCTPVPGDQIMGFVTRGGGVSVHRTDCTNATSLQQQAERIIEVHWAPSPSSVFLVAIQVEALDRHRLLSDVTRVLADERVNILSASVTTSGDRVAISRFTFEMGDPKHLGHLLDVVRNVEGVFDVYRVTSAA